MKKNPKLFLFIFLLSFFSLGCKSDKAPFPDPAEQPKTDGYKDPAQYDSPFANVPNTQDIIMYEVNLRAFSNEGTLKGVEQKLDAIRDLGVNVIWLMPIHPMGVEKGIGSPYAVKNYREVGAEYGNLDDLRNLVKEAHKRNMAVLMDLVANHTAWDNPWIANKSWYTQDGSGNIISPAGMGWNDVADLNYNNADLRKEMIRTMKYWVLTANIDGYRCDYANGVPQTFWKAAIDTLRKIPNRNILMFAEGDRKDHFSAGFNLTFGFGFFDALKNVYGSNASASTLQAAHFSEYSGIPAGAQILRFTSNHDNNLYDDTPLGLFGGAKGSMTAFVLASFMGGVPLLYNGQEIGYATKIPFFTRSPINWSNADAAMTAEYKKLIAFRKSSNAVKQGTLQAFTNHPGVSAFKRISGNEQVFVLVNTTAGALNYTLEPSVANTNWINAMNNASLSLGTQIALEPRSYLILKNQ